jgi:hypothetical protein
MPALKITGKKRPRAEEGENATAAAAEASAPTGFAAAVRKVLARELHVGPAAGAVLSKRRTAAEKAEAAERALAKALRKRSAMRHAKVVERNALPSALSADVERDLRRMATKGVIALFNAVAKHQHATQVALAEPAERAVRAQRVGAAQASFLDLLRDTTRAAAAAAGGAAPPPAAAASSSSQAAKRAKGSGAAWMAEDFVEAAGNARGRRAADQALERHNEAAAAAPQKGASRRSGGMLDVQDEF